MEYKPAAAADPFTIRDKWALVIGISQFQDGSIKPLTYAAKSAQDLSNVLRDPQFGRFAAGHVRLVTNGHATKYGIEAVGVDGWLLKKALPNDLVLIYLCTRIAEAPGSSSYYLCASDTIGSDTGNTGIQLDTFLSELKRRIQSKHIICLLDTAPTMEATDENGYVADRKEAESAGELVRRSGVSVFSASELGQTSYCVPGNSESSFAHYLVDAIKSAQGMMPLVMVAQHVSRDMESECTRAAAARQPLLVFTEDNGLLARIPIGVVIKSSFPAESIHFGHRVDSLALDRPDLDEKINTNYARVSAVQKDSESPESFSPKDFTVYLSRIKQSIQKKWQPPAGFQDHAVATVFTITADGTIADESVVESSGNAAVDKSALTALRAASPVDPLPPGSPQEVQIRYKFNWHVTATK